MPVPPYNSEIVLELSVIHRGFPVHSLKVSWRRTPDFEIAALFRCYLFKVVHGAVVVGGEIEYAI